MSYWRRRRLQSLHAFYSLSCARTGLLRDSVKMRYYSQLFTRAVNMPISVTQFVIICLFDYVSRVGSTGWVVCCVQYNANSSSPGQAICRNSASDLSGIDAAPHKGTYLHAVCLNMDSCYTYTYNSTHCFFGRTSVPDCFAYVASNISPYLIPACFHWLRMMFGWNIAKCSLICRLRG